MEETLRIAVFGDSLMKGTLPDAQLRYHFHTDLFEAPLAGLHAEVTNRSVFGATSRKGVALVQRDLARGHRYDWALVEYGGNDCNYNWPDVAAHPEQDHDPVVLVDEFRANMAAIVQMLREADIRPIFTTLPPIDEVKYLACIDHNGASAVGVMQWLGDVRRIAGRRYDFILANINRNILAADMPAYAAALAAGGDLVMSGFLEPDVPAITACAEKLGLRPVATAVKEGWVTVHVRKE